MCDVNASRCWLKFSVGVQGSQDDAEAKLAEAGVGGPPVLRARLHSALQQGRGRLVAFLRLPANPSPADSLDAGLEKVRMQSLSVNNILQDPMPLQPSLRETLQPFSMLASFERMVLSSLPAGNASPPVHVPVRMACTMHAMPIPICFNILCACPA